MDALISELVKQAAQQNAAMVEPVGRTDGGQHSGPSKFAEMAYLTGLAGDVGTTTYGSLSGKTTEANPMMKWAGKAAGPAVGGISILSSLLAKKALKNHPKALNILLTAMGGVHGAAALHNVGQIKQAPPAMPSGDYVNYDYFPTLGK